VRALSSLGSARGEARARRGLWARPRPRGRSPPSKMF